MDLRDFFEPGGSEKLCLLAKHFMGLNGTEETSSSLEALLVLARTVSRSENNKSKLSFTMDLRIEKLFLCASFL